MIARIARSTAFSVAVLIVVSLLASLGVLWWTGSVLTSAAIGTMCGLAAAFAVDSLHTAFERAGGWLSDENDRSSGGSNTDQGRPTKQQGVDPKGSQK
jgi:hypothetical protein